MGAFLVVDCNRRDSAESADSDADNAPESGRYAFPGRVVRQSQRGCAGDDERATRAWAAKELI